MRLSYDTLTRDQRRAIAPQINRAAHHEAGHALICVLHDVPIEYARLNYALDDLGNGEGYLSVDGSIRADTEHDPEVAVVCGAAGPVAGAYWTHKDEGGSLSRLIRQWWEHHTAESDVEMVRRYLPQTSMRERDAIDEAESMVRKHWSDLRDVARELVKRDELPGRRIATIID